MQVASLLFGPDFSCEAIVCGYDTRVKIAPLQRIEEHIQICCIHPRAKATRQFRAAILYVTKDPGSAVSP
ncbi:hypothetical protein HY57_13255 [Dyella japonica A8]|uniref:Uncharacterized protein n=1 Tax=Dyella japonica A8 TaxID=1217721 RepID=A0A075K7Q0_9GAMM|nr:hypothetical protein HY57_13255 [Dyella japonica A8]